MAFLAAAIFGVVWVGPRAQGRSLTVNAHLRETGCVEALDMEITQDRQRMRALSQRPPADGRVAYEAQLPAGRYRLTVALQCKDSSRVSVQSRPIDLTEGDLDVPITVTQRCACENGGDDDATR